MDKKEFSIKDYINDFYNNEVYQKPKSDYNDFGLYERSDSTRTLENADRYYDYKNYIYEKNKLNNKDKRNSKKSFLKKIKKIFKAFANNKTKKENNNNNNLINNSINTNINNSRNKTRKKKINLKKISVIILIFVMYMISLYLIEDSKKIRIILDAGHGGNDVGATYNDRYEKNDNMEITNMIYQKLKAEKNIKVIMTRKDDVYLSLEERVKLANKKRAKLLISIHRNDAETGNGVEIWIPNDYNETEMNIAENILESISESNISRNRGVKIGTSEKVEGDYYLNRYFNADSLIIELGFMSNTLDNNLFDQNKEDYANKIANAIIKSVNYHYSLVEE